MTLPLIYVSVGLTEKLTTALAHVCDGKQLQRSDIIPIHVIEETDLTKQGIMKWSKKRKALPQYCTFDTEPMLETFKEYMLHYDG